MTVLAMRRMLAVAFLALWAALASCASAQDKQVEYRLRPGDQIRILVYQNTDLTLETRLTEAGTISYPLIGIIRLGDLTVSEAEQAIAAQLRAGGFIEKPQVTVIVQQARGNYVSVLGQVSKPGRIALETVNVRISEILAAAGGISSSGADVAVVNGIRDGKPYHREVDIVPIFLNNRSADDLVLAPGDVIYVHRAPVYYIYGEVQKPGSYRLERGMTVRQALALAGGPSSRGTERSPNLYRRAPDGKIETVSPDLNDPVQPDDVYYVREALF